MNSSLTPIERLVLESATRGNKTLNSLSFDSGISKDLLTYILNELALKELILIKNDQYLLNTNLDEKMLSILKDKKNCFYEINEILKSHLKSSLSKSDEKNFSFKKFALNESQKKLLHAMFYNIESFLKECHQDNKEMQTKDYTLIYWGQTTYGKEINNIMDII